MAGYSGYFQGYSLMREGFDGKMPLMTHLVVQQWDMEVAGSLGRKYDFVLGQPLVLLL